MFPDVVLPDLRVKAVVPERDAQPGLEAVLNVKRNTVCGGDGGSGGTAGGGSDGGGRGGSGATKGGGVGGDGASPQFTVTWSTAASPVKLVPRVYSKAKDDE